MAEYISDRELRIIERQRRIEEEEEERKLLEELDRELKEGKEQELKNLKAQQERIRREKREKLERKRQILEKQKQLEEMKENRTLMEESLNRINDLSFKSDNAVNKTVRNKVPQNVEYDVDNRNESLNEGNGDENNINDSLYTTWDDVDQEIITDIGKPTYASSFTDSYQDRVRTIEKEMEWLEDKERKYYQENEELEQNTDRKKYKLAETKFETTYRDLKDKTKHRSYEKDIKREDIRDDIRINYGESDEEFELQEKIEQLQAQKRIVEEKIERNKLLKEMQRKEIERKRIEELKLRKEKQMRKEEKLRKLKDEKDRLEKELKVKETTLYGLQNIPEIETKTANESRIRQAEPEKITKSYPRSDKLLKPAVPKLTETTFEEWKIEVEVIMKSGLYEESMLRQAVRNSLSGQTRKILLTIPASTSTRDIIEKLDSVYGNVRSGESVLAEFYMARQRWNEGIAEWGIRLESILQTAIEKRQIKESQKNEMLKTRFWRQLYSEELKNATRMYYETTETFEELRRKVRIEENEMKSAKEGIQNMEEISSRCRGDTEVEEQVSLLQDLVARMNLIEKEISNTKERQIDDRNKQEYDQRNSRGLNRRDEYYETEKRYHEKDRRDDYRYTREREKERYRGNSDRYYRENGIENRNHDRYKAYRERGRYSPGDRRNGRRDFVDERQERRYYRENKSTNEGERRNRWRRYEDRDYGYNRDYRQDYGNRRERDYERDNRDNREEREQRRKYGDREKPDEKGREADDKQQNRDKEESNRKTGDEVTESKSNLNSKTSLSRGR